MHICELDRCRKVSTPTEPAAPANDNARAEKERGGVRDRLLATFDQPSTDSATDARALLARSWCPTPQGLWNRRKTGAAAGAGNKKMNPVAPNMDIERELAAIHRSFMRAYALGSAAPEEAPCADGVRVQT